MNRVGVTRGTRVTLGCVGGAPAGARGRICVAVLSLFVVLASAGCSSWRAANLYQSGTLALDAGAVERAVQELEEAAGLEPQRSEIRNHLGLAYAASGDAVAAEAAFEAAVAMDCDNEAARRNLAALRAGELRLVPAAEPDTMSRSHEPARAPR